MIECEATLKAWGNSIGFIIPKDKLKGAKLRPRQKVRAIITPLRPLLVRDVFGKLKQWRKPTARILREVDRELDSKFF